MSKFLRLFKFKFSNQIGLSELKTAFASPRERTKAFAILLLILSIITVFLFSFILMMAMMYKSFERSNNKDLYLDFVFIFAQIVSLFTVIISSFNSMFNGKEHNILSPLPIKREHIFMTSYVVLYVSALISTLLVILPGLGVYQYYEGFSVTFTLRALLGFVLFPALPAAVVSFVMFIAMIIAGRFRYTELISTLLGLALVIVCFMLYISLSTGTVNFTQDNVSDTLIQNSGVIELMSKCMINVFAYKLMLGSVYEFLIGTCILLILFVVTGTAVYYPGGKLYEKAIQNLATSTGGKGGVIKKYRKSTVKIAMLKKEFKMLLRSPTYVLNCMINVILGPLAIFILGIRINKGATGAEDIFSIFTDFFKSNMNSEYVICGLITAATIAITTLSMVASTCISREGGNYAVMQTVPVSYKDQIKVKLTCALIINLVCVITTMSIGGVLFNLDFLLVLVGIIICIFAFLPFNYIGAFIDVMKPKIYWDRESQAVKQNANGMISMFLCMILTILYVIPLALYVTGIIESIVFVVVLTLIIEIAFNVLTRTMLFRLIKNKEIYR